jgi:hypothetical protein
MAKALTNSEQKQQIKDSLVSFLNKEGLPRYFRELARLDSKDYTNEISKIFKYVVPILEETTGSRTITVNVAESHSKGGNTPQIIDTSYDTNIIDLAAQYEEEEPKEDEPFDYGTPTTDIEIANDNMALNFPPESGIKPQPKEDAEVHRIDERTHETIDTPARVFKPLKGKFKY